MSGIETVILLVAKNIAYKVAAQESVGYFKILWNKIFPPINYIKRLLIIINETIDEYEIHHPYNSKDKRFPFYHSQMAFERLLECVIFHEDKIKELRFEFEKNPNIIIPTENDLNEFLDLFIAKVRNDTDLKNMYIVENYQNEIFAVSKGLKLLSRTVDKISDDTHFIREQVQEQKKKESENELTPQKVVEALQDQVKKQLEKQTSSGKYIQRTFIENSIEKDLLRYACYPLLFLKKEFEEINNLDFRRLNKKLKKHKLPEFNLKLEGFRDKINQLAIADLDKIVKEIKNHLETKDTELRQLNYSRNEKYKFETKLTRKVNVIPWFIYKIILVTETAGQGKTNYLCDFAERFLLKRNIPTVFLTGYELDSSDIRKSIVSRIFPFRNQTSFSEILEIVDQYCKANSCYFVIIIDGLNENLNARTFANNLEQFLLDISKYDLIKIILSCRTEYFANNFSNIQQYIDSGRIGSIKSLNNRLSEKTKEKLFETYCRHFNVGVKHISNKAQKQLVDNFLLLRIFAETYKDQNNLEFENIYREELFYKYYKLKCDEINKRIDNNEFGVSGKFELSQFLTKIVEYMVQHSQYRDIPLDELIDCSQNRQIYIRFLDENILVRRDLTSQSPNLFTDQEVVNFTFDEFRDYVISNYLVEIIFKKSKEIFVQFLEVNLTKHSPIQEGCRTYLFLSARKPNNEQLNEIIKKQRWYNEAFKRGIFSIRDDEVSDEDLTFLRNLFYSSLECSTFISKTIIYHRYDCERFKKLNIEFLFSLLQEMDVEQCEKLFYPAFPYNTTRYSQSQLLDEFIDQIEHIFQDNRLEGYLAYHNLFHVLIYFFPVHWKAEDLYERYYSRYPGYAQKQLGLVLKSRNNKLVIEVSNFVRINEIRI